MLINDILRRHRFAALAAVFVVALSLAVPQLVFSTRPPSGGVVHCRQVAGQ